MIARRHGHCRRRRPDKRPHPGSKQRIHALSLSLSDRSTRRLSSSSACLIAVQPRYIIISGALSPPSSCPTSCCSVEASVFTVALESRDLRFWEAFLLGERHDGEKLERILLG